MALVISDSFLEKFEITSSDLLVDIACFLYEKERMSFGKAKSFSGLNRRQFQKALNDRNIYMNYGIEDFEVDLKSIKEEL